MEWALLLLNLIILSLNVWAAITVRSTFAALQTKLATQSNRSLVELDAECTALATGLSSLSTTVRRLSSREGMRDVRARRSEASETGELLPPTLVGAERKAKLRRLMASGKLVPSRDGALPPAD